MNLASSLSLADSECTQIPDTSNNAAGNVFLHNFPYPIFNLDFIHFLRAQKMDKVEPRRYLHTSPHDRHSEFFSVTTELLQFLPKWQELQKFRLLSSQTASLAGERAGGDLIESEPVHYDEWLAMISSPNGQSEVLQISGEICKTSVTIQS